MIGSQPKKLNKFFKRIPKNLQIVTIGIVVIILLSLALNKKFVADSSKTIENILSTTTMVSVTPTPTTIKINLIKVTISPIGPTTTAPSPTSKQESSPTQPAAPTSTSTPSEPGPDTSDPATTTDPTKGTISGAFYDSAKWSSESNKDNALIADSSFAAAARLSNGYPSITGSTGNHAKWSLTNLLPGKYNVSIDYNSSKYTLNYYDCSNCQATHVGQAQIEVDLKAGDNLQTFWRFTKK